MHSATTCQREVKALMPWTGQDQKEAIEALNRSFEAFKSANDERLGQIERGSADPLTAQKLEKLSSVISNQQAKIKAMEVKHHRPRKNGGAPGRYASPEHKQAFARYMRRGETQALAAAEAKSLSIGSNPDGGYLVPEQTEAEIGRRLGALSPIRSIASIRLVSSQQYKKPHTVDGPMTGWVGESASRPETDSPTIDALAFPAMELYAMPAATSALLDDAAVDIDAWLAEEIEAAFAEQEGEAFVTGNGTDRPRGFLDYPTAPNSTATWGQIGTIGTGVDGGFPLTNPADKIVDLVFALKAGHRQNGHFVMNRQTQAAVRKLKDAEGRYLWEPSNQAGQPSTILGYPIVEADHMPDIATGANAIAFGDFGRGYLIVDRQGVRVLRDPYSAKPYVLFYTTKRVGGGVQNFDAIKLLTFES